MEHVIEIETQLEGELAGSEVFTLGGKGVDDGGKVGGVVRGKDLDLELQNVSDLNLPPLQSKSLSGKDR